MSDSVISWTPYTPPLAPSVVAIGVFDGVHIGHQELLRDTVLHAHRAGALPVALTFDRDPDQVVTPDTAAPQLLTLEDKCRFIIECGIEHVIVVPFTESLAAMRPESFLDQVLGACCELKAVHVGADFRFGARAQGNLDALYVWGVEHGADIEPHKLVHADGQPVTSTRIRGLVASGLVAEAAELLGRPTRVSGTVHRGRGEGLSIGFATANIAPVEHAAIPADGVYAGRAVLVDGSVWPAAISSGRPPTFPEATDYLEAHLIDFEGNLYDESVTLEFVERLRDQHPFESAEALADAIEDDIGRTLEIVEAAPASSYDDDEWVDDPAALEAAEKAVGVMHRDAEYDGEHEWVELAGPRRLSGVLGDAGFSAALITAPLDAAGIPHVWDPYPPEMMPSWRAGYGAFDRPFTLMVPQDRLDEAREVMRAAGVGL